MFGCLVVLPAGRIATCQADQITKEHQQCLIEMRISDGEVGCKIFESI